MNLVQAKCTNCGASLQVDKAQDAAICPYCNTPYIVEKAIANYYINSDAVSGMGNISNAEHVTYNINVYHNNEPSQTVRYVPAVPTVSEKSKTTALLLCIFLGFLGIHRFYVGKKGTGILWLLTGGLFYCGWIIDIFQILFGNFRDSNNLPLKK